jgi:FkbM family methyltransferase
MDIFGALRRRLPGGIHFKELMSTFNMSSMQTSGNQVEKIILETRKKNIRNRFFFGHEYSERVYGDHVIINKFISSESPEYYDFKGIRIPVPITKSDYYALRSEVFDLIFYYLIENKKIYELVASEGPYELSSSEGVSISQGDIVIDAGANIGVFSALASSKGAMVYAFEPNDYTIETYLSKTSELNQNINICRCALSDKREKMDLLIPVHGTMAGSQLAFINNGTYDVQTQSAETIPLDDFVHDNNLSRVDFIKADIEGAERYMLMGAKNVLKEFAPKISICTYHLPDDPKVLRELILDANPDYVIEERWKKMYAYVPK